jgi:hypothetical protein
MQEGLQARMFGPKGPPTGGSLLQTSVTVGYERSATRL